MRIRVLAGAATLLTAGITASLAVGVMHGSQPSSPPSRGSPQQLPYGFRPEPGSHGPLLTAEDSRHVGAGFRDDGVMPLTPEEVQQKRFSTVRFKEGYDEVEVDVFLGQATEELRGLHARIGELEAQLRA